MPLLPTLLAFAPQLVAVRTDEPPAIDGRIEEKVWRRAPASAELTQKRPHEGAEPTERTEVRVLYDDDAVYVGIACDQRHAPLSVRMSRRDREVETDWVSVAIDARGDGRSAFEFTLSAAGVLRDALRYNDTERAPDWDETWDAAVSRTRHRWSAEFSIPLRVLRYPRRATQSWGLEVRRHIAALQETDEWAFIPRATAGEVSRYGRLEGIEGLEEKQALELRPFILARMSPPDPSALDVPSRAATSASAGLDAKWHPSHAVTVDLAVNPDFGQVEADQVVLNLTNFETLFPEKRPFFIEGIDTFATPLPLLYTRRIGRAPELPALAEGDRLAAAPEPVPIYAAVKSIGEAGSFRFGTLSAVTGAERLTVRTPGGDDERLAAPLTTFHVLRTSAVLGEQGHVGATATSTTRLEPNGYPLSADGVHRLCPGGELVASSARCFHDAYTASVDGGWRSGSGDWVVDGQLLGSLIDNGPPRTQPDGTVISSGDLAPAGYARVAKEGGEHWVGEVLYDGHADRVDYNDAGFMLRQNQHHFAGDLGYRTLEPSGLLRETLSKIEVFDRETTDWLELARGYQLNTSGELRNFWRYFVELHYREAHFDDREIGDGAALERAALVGVEIEGSTDPREPVTFSLATLTQYLWNGVFFTGEGDLTLHALPELDLELLPSLTHTSGEPRFVGDAPEGSYLFGRLRATSVGLTLRATYTFSPTLTLQGYAQAFLAAGEYTGFLSYPFDPTAVIHLDALVPAAPPPESPDFEEGALNASLVFRWEYLPGSVLYLVYSHAQNTALTPSFARRARVRVGDIEPRPAADAFLAKLSYWWGT